jgi:hypothetical protein
MGVCRQLSLGWLSQSVVSDLPSGAYAKDLFFRR